MAGGGGAWKVAYADFVTAMMAFFMVMWLVGQNSKIKEAVAEHFQHDPLEELIFNDSTDDNRESGGPRRGNGRFGKRKGESARSVSPSESPLDPTDIKPRVLMLHNTERTGMATIVPFASHSSELTDEGKRRINDLLPLIDGKPHKIEVRGHCSEPTAEGGADEFWKLAFARALAVQHYMQSEGVPAERMRLSVAGRHEPFTLKEDRDFQARNERVEVYLLNEFVEDLQGTRAEREKRMQQSTSANYTLTAADGESPPIKAPAKQDKPAAKDDHDHGH